MEQFTQESALYVNGFKIVVSVVLVNWVGWFGWL